jgi:SAM-dependent methyltransferase
MWGEHRSRYHFAAKYVDGRTVLDIACGTGFGAKILAEAGAATVIAADYSIDALEVTSEMNAAKIAPLRTDGTRLPFADGMIDAVTSFETVEHIPDHDKFVSELKRVLREDGVAVMSTPNALYTKPVNGKPINPFHVYEFTPDEFGRLLKKHFSSVELYGQRVVQDYRICPYWEKPDMLPRDLVSRSRIALWKLQCRLPAGLREGLSQIFTGRQFFPGENDFSFSAEELNAGYVQVAVCRP